MLSFIRIARPLAAFRIAPLLFAAGASGGCQADSRPRGDAAFINESLLKVLTANGKRICVDRGTHGEPLAVFRAMLPAPDPVRRTLSWSAPTPLEDGRAITNRELFDIELGDGQVVLREPTQNGARLPFTAQLQLNALAREGSYQLSDSGPSVANSPAAPLAQVRWWLSNRFDSSCGEVYTFSKPIVMRDMGFVSVTAGHRGTTYAFRKDNNAWAPLAKWSTWLY
ncbi:hypothetical protein [uncultured Sphingomonas sp.]|uniref:hypothetical protein n=1 Tax=uncultured Sphingomonas sp. TaxID=158754 RepID=UPI0035C95C96